LSLETHHDQFVNGGDTSFNDVYLERLITCEGDLGYYSRQNRSPKNRREYRMSAFPSPMDIDETHLVFMLNNNPLGSDQ
jgi:hypothetical protein